MDKKRCPWCEVDDLYRAYHDEEWGVPVYEDRKWFEFLMLEGAQAGLSWHTVLKKRENYRIAFDDFDPAKVALYDELKIQELIGNAGIIRNRLKIQSAVRNARAFLKIQEDFGSFNDYIWGFTDHEVIQNDWSTMAQVPVQTKEAEAMSKDLKKRGFNFVGPTICYAFMQATGMVNDHLKECWKSKI